jgi:hypothetical protein
LVKHSSNEILFIISGRGQPAKKSQPQVMADALLLDTEAAVMSSFAFLEPADVEMDDEDYMGDDMDMVSGTDADMKQLKLKTKGVIVNDGERRKDYKFIHLINFKCLSSVDDADAEAEEVLNDLNRLVEGEDANMNLNDSQRQQDGDWNQHGKFMNIYNKIFIFF